MQLVQFLLFQDKLFIILLVAAEALIPPEAIPGLIQRGILSQHRQAQELSRNQDSADFLAMRDREDKELIVSGQ